jgi:hypothetical protein
MGLRPPSAGSSQVVAASGDATGATDVANMNAALTAAAAAGGGVVKGKPGGTYYVNAPWIIGSNTTLDMTGCTITEVAGQNVITTALGAQAVIGQSVTIANAFSAGNHLTGVVSAKTSTTITVTDYVGTAINATSTVSAAKVDLYTRDTRVEIIGGTWQRGTNGYIAGAFDPAKHTSWLRHIDGLHIAGLTMTASERGYHIDLAHVTDFHVDRLTINSPTSVLNTDGVHVTGPARWGVISQITGYAGDDLIGMTSTNGFTATGLADTQGDIVDVLVDGVFPKNTGLAALKIHAGIGSVMRGITARHLHGTGQAGVRIQDGAATTSASDVGGILLEDIDLQTVVEAPVTIYANNPKGVITVRDIVWRGNTNSWALVNVLAGTTLAKIVVENATVVGASGANSILRMLSAVPAVRISGVNSHSLLSFVLNFNPSTGTTIDHAIVENVAAYYTSVVSSHRVVANNATIKALTLRNIYLNGSSQLFTTTTAQSGTMHVNASDITLDGAYQGGTVLAAVDISLANLKVLSLNQTQLFALTGGSAALTVRGRGATLPGSVTTFTRDSTQTPRIINPDMPVDLSTVTRANNGDTAYNTNAGLACGVGVALSNGANAAGSWKNVFSGATY